MAIAQASSSRLSAGRSAASMGKQLSGGLASPLDVDVIAAYKRGVEEREYPHPVAAISALVEVIENSKAATITGLASELKAARALLVETQPSIGVQAGCQLWERFFATSAGGSEFLAYKRSLIAQGKNFCETTAPVCRQKIADMAVGFLRDDCTILTHACSRVVIETILKAHKQHKRINVYVTETRPHGLGLKTYEILTAAGIPCNVVMDNAVGYIMERVDMVLVGAEAVVESGGVVSAVGTYQVALIAKAMQKPFYALAESYKLLRHFPLSQTDLPIPQKSRDAPLSFPSGGGLPPTQNSLPQKVSGASSAVEVNVSGNREMTKEMEELNPTIDVTSAELIDFIITDLAEPLSPTSISQYLVAQFI